MKSEEGKAYYGNIDDNLGFSFDKSREDKMEAENVGPSADFEMQMEEKTEMRDWVIWARIDLPYIE